MTDIVTLAMLAGVLVATWSIRTPAAVLLRNHRLDPHLRQVLEAAPGCTVVAVLAPRVVSDQPADLIALALTLYAATRYPPLAVILFAALISAALRALL